ncbi:hypothetical protein Q0Z83_040100 [Actinoplanes sichuanensis]|nr:hypothetical protein Q0Z83_040100 [Actinoplanes sichuanensis]
MTRRGGNRGEGHFGLAVAVWARIAICRSACAQPFEDRGVVRNGDRYRLNPEMMDTDLLEWRTLTSEARQAISDVARADACRKMLDLSRGLRGGSGLAKDSDPAHRGKKFEPVTCRWCSPLRGSWRPRTVDPSSDSGVAWFVEVGDPGLFVYRRWSGAKGIVEVAAWVQCWIVPLLGADRGESGVTAPAAVRFLGGGDYRCNLET